MNSRKEQIRAELGARLRKLREASQMSITELSKCLGISRPSYYSAEAGQRDLAPDELLTIMWIYGVDIRWLLGLVADQPARKADKGAFRIVVADPHLVEMTERLLRKGGEISIKGELRTRARIDKDGKTREMTENVLGLFHSELTRLPDLASGRRALMQWGQRAHGINGNQTLRTQDAEDCG